MIILGVDEEIMDCFSVLLLCVKKCVTELKKRECKNSNLP